SWARTPRHPVSSARSAPVARESSSPRRSAASQPTPCAASRSPRSRSRRSGTRRGSPSRRSPAPCACLVALRTIDRAQRHQGCASPASRCRKLAAPRQRFGRSIRRNRHSPPSAWDAEEAVAHRALRTLAAGIVLALAGGVLAGCSTGGPAEVRFHLSKPEAIPYFRDLIREYNDSQDEIEVVFDTSSNLQAGFLR